MSDTTAILTFVVFPAVLLGIYLCYLTRGIMYYSVRNDNQQIVRAAAQAEKWGWPSGMHAFANGKAHMKEFAVIALAFVQRLICDKKSDYALVVLCIICQTIAAVLIVLVAQNYWGSSIAFIVFCAYLLSFWPKLIALWGGVVAVAEVTFLASVLCFQNAVVYYYFSQIHPPTVEAKMIWYFLGGISVGLTLFASASSRKYLPLSLAAYLYSLNCFVVRWQNSIELNTPYGLAVVWITGIFILGVIIIRSQMTKVITGLYQGRGSEMLQNLLSRKESKPLEHYLGFGRQICGLATSFSLLLIVDLALSFLFSNKLLYWQTQFYVLAGIFSAAIMLTFPNVLKNLKGYYFYSQYGKPTWRSRFYGYRDFFAGMGKPIKDDMRGAGWMWVVKYFYLMVPALCLLSVGLIGFYVYAHYVTHIHFDSIYLLGARIDLMFVTFLIAVMPIVMAEASGAVQVGRSYYPGLMGLLFMMGVALDQCLSIHWRSEELYWSFVGFIIVMSAWHVARNLIVLFSDVLPARMAPTYLLRKLWKLGVKKFYTYNSPYNDSFVKCLPDEVRKEFEISFIKSIKDVKEGYVVVPPTNPKSVMMSDYPQGKDKEFEEDPALNELIGNREILKMAVCSFKTFASSRIWVHEAEVPTYRDLILKEVTDEDRFKGLAWLIKI